MIQEEDSEDETTQLPAFEAPVDAKRAKGKVSEMRITKRNADTSESEFAASSDSSGQDFPRSDTDHDSDHPAPHRRPVTKVSTAPTAIFSNAVPDVPASVEAGLGETQDSTQNVASTCAEQPNPVKPKAVKKLQFTDIHPEMVDIWHKVESQPLIDPELIEQPKDMLVQLLPFQLEGLNWLQKQEDSSCDFLFI